MSSQDEIGKGFLGRLQAEREANRAKGVERAEQKEAAFSSIRTGVASLSKEIEKLGNPQWSLKSRGIEEEPNGDSFMGVHYNKNGRTEIVNIKLRRQGSGRSDFLISGLPDRAQNLISGARHQTGSSNVVADANQGFEIAKALEEYAVIFFADGQ